MITLHNGHKIDFLCASGALGLDGEGYWFERPWKWMGRLLPDEFTIITKTLTYWPRRGNLVWWHPWTCVRLLKSGGIVNCVGLTNPGLYAWVETTYPETRGLGRKLIVSICPEGVPQAESMAGALEPLDIVGIEVNVSCPNTEKGEEAVRIVRAVLNATKHPVIVKLTYDDEMVNVCKELDGQVAAFDLINSVPWDKIFPEETSPLEWWCNVKGGVSGPPIKQLARDAIAKVKMHCKTPIISGGGIDSIEEVYARFVIGARAVTFGTLFLKRPWLPNQIVAEARTVMKKA